MTCLIKPTLCDRCLNATRRPSFQTFLPHKPLPSGFGVWGKQSTPTPSPYLARLVLLVQRDEVVRALRLFAFACREQKLFVIAPVRAVSEVEHVLGVELGRALGPPNVAQHGAVLGSGLRIATKQNREPLQQVFRTMLKPRRIKLFMYAKNFECINASAVTVTVVVTILVAHPTP